MAINNQYHVISIPKTLCAKNLALRFFLVGTNARKHVENRILLSARNWLRKRVHVDIQQKKSAILQKSNILDDVRLLVVRL